MGASHSRPEGGDEHPRRRPQSTAAMDTSGYPTSDEPPQHLTPATTMGASHSQSAGDEPARREPRRRLKLGRRLSTLLGRDSSVSKRERSNSHHSGVSSSSRPAPKRPRLRGVDIDEGPEAAYPSASASTSMPSSSGPDSASTSTLTTGSGSTPPSAYASAAASMSAFAPAAASSSALRSTTPSAASLAPTIPTIATPSLCPDSLSPGRASTMHTQPSSRPASHFSSSRTTSSPPSILQASTPTGGADEFNLDRLHAMSGAQETLGSERTPTPSITNDTPGQTWQSVLGRFRRTSQRGDRDTPTPPRAATPASTNTQAGPATSAAPPAPPLARSLQHRLSAIMGFSTPSSSAADDVSPPPAPPPAAAPPANNEADAAEEGESRAIPVGAVLVIQGLAQTHANVDGANADGSGRLDLQSLEQQARMIGNLLTVAAAATATTLLSPETVTQQPTRATAQNAMQSIIERIRPHRNRSSGSASGSASPNPTQTIENALGDYLRHVLRDNRRFTDNITRDSPPQASVPSEFQQFLHTLQEDLIRAVRGYAAPWADEEEAAQEVVETPALTDEERRAAGLPPLAETATTAPANAEAGSSLPAFHRQPGQVTAAERALGVSGGTEGVPRRLNFFRAHLFPPANHSGPNGSEGEDDDPVVPSIFVGVRSIAHHASMTTDDLVGHPSFPFLDGHVPETSTEAHTHASDPLADPAAMDGAPAAASGSDDVPQFERDIERELMEAETAAPRHRTLRERFVNRLTRGREPERAPAPLNTYLIYVIGGNYPRSHPILHIPALVTGGPLSADDLQLLSELLGPARPPTATADEIARSDLRVVPARELAGLGDDTVFDACVASCGVCLAEYEEDDECRVLKCKHAFHRECVDHWLCAGRNSCPTCRSEVVDKNALAPAAEADSADAPQATEDATDAHVAQSAT